jgi:hypothetical protein
MKMKQLKHILLFIILIIIFLYLYIYVIYEKFDDSIPTITSSLPISSQLTLAIANMIGVSPRRISNLSFTGDISKLQLNVSFIILEANLIELSNNEMKASDATTFSNGLFNSGKFIIYINNKSILLNQSQTNNTPTTTANFFDNTNLITIANYATNKYISVPTDASLTKFYTLDMDNNYKVKPSLITIPNMY